MNSLVASAKHFRVRQGQVAVAVELLVITSARTGSPMGVS